MTEIRETVEFTRWLSKLRDQKAADRIKVRIRRLSLGNPGDVKSIGGGISEKSTQETDIRRARRLADELQEN